MDYLKKRYKKNGDVVFRRISDESILVPIKDNVGDLGFIYTINDVGTFIWERIDGKRQLVDIKELLINEFDVSPSKAESDLLEFVAHLEKMGIIKADQIKETGAKIVAAPCHNCIDQLMELNKHYEMGVEIKTVCEIAADALVIDGN